MTALTALRILKRPWGARALAAALLTVGLVAAGGTASAATSPAGHATGITRAASTGFCHDPKLGGTFYCDLNLGYKSGEAWWQFPNSTLQVFVIGTNLAVWTRWNNLDGGWSAWTSMGGVAIQYPPLFYLGGKFVQNGAGSYTPDLTVVGGDGGVWHRQRNTSGNWTPWKAGY